MADKKQEDNRDVFEKVLDWAVPVGAALVVGKAGQKLGRRALRYKGKIIDQARREGMNDEKIQRTMGNDWSEVTAWDALERNQIRPGMTKAQIKVGIDDLKRAQAEARGYGRTGKARLALTAGSAAVGYKAGSDINEYRKKR